MEDYLAIWGIGIAVFAAGMATGIWMSARASKQELRQAEQQMQDIRAIRMKLEQWI